MAFSLSRPLNGGLEGLRIVSQARPSRTERGSGEVPIVELF